ncbi:MAG: hypothetical protein M0C28_25680 [Candidatus Moduliflexus flocculans]|nr:hypothetical protein [Candidatus Moduliflexus flocculans]
MAESGRFRYSGRNAAPGPGPPRRGAVPRSEHSPRRPEEPCVPSWTISLRRAPGPGPRIRLAVTARLVAAAAPAGPRPPGALRPGPFRPALKVPGLPRALVAGPDGRVSAWAVRGRPPSACPRDLTLLFPLGPGTSRPGPGRGPRERSRHPGRLQRGRPPRVASGAVAAAAAPILGSPETPAAGLWAAPASWRAAVSALVETAAADPYVAPKLEHAPGRPRGRGRRGGVRRAAAEARAPGSGWCRFPERTPDPPGRAVRTGRTAGRGSARTGGGRAGCRPNRLRFSAFRDPGAAVAVLSGKKSAITALGSCDGLDPGPRAPGAGPLRGPGPGLATTWPSQADKEAGHGR